MTDSFNAVLLLAAIVGIAISQSALDVMYGVTSFLAGIGVAALLLRRNRSSRAPHPPV